LGPSVRVLSTREKQTNKKTPQMGAFCLLLRTVDAFRTANWTKIKSELQFSGILGLFPTLSLQNA
jgi:hypothetical protein